MDCGAHSPEGGSPSVGDCVRERTWTWLENARILTRDYERLPENHEGMIYIVMIRLMLRRLAKNRRTWKPKNA